MNDIDKKISELYDGELDHDEIEGLLEIISADPELQKKLSMYSLAGIASDFKTNEVVSINSHDRSNKNIATKNFISKSVDGIVDGVSKLKQLKMESPSQR